MISNFCWFVHCPFSQYKKFWG